MKTVWITLVAMVILLMAGCNSHMTTWGMTSTSLDNPDNGYGVRVGLCNGDEAGDVEGGIELEYSGIHDRPESYSLYAIYHMAGDQSSWLGQPYVGARVGTDGDGAGLYGPMVGTLYWDVFFIEAKLAQEYTGKLSQVHNDENDSEYLSAGLRFEF